LEAQFEAWDNVYRHDIQKAIGEQFRDSDDEAYEAIDAMNPMEFDTFYSDVIAERIEREWVNETGNTMCLSNFDDIVATVTPNMLRVWQAYNPAQLTLAA
jgi:hypothetical protein